MAQISRRVVLLPTSLEYKRVERIFDEIAPDKVRILYNSDPIGIHQDLNQEVLEEARSIVDNRTNCYERDEVYEDPVDFYRFHKALIDTYKLIYRESRLENEVFVNISGGTKPVAVALSYACSLAETGQPLYFPGKDYESENGQAKSQDVVQQAFEVDPLQLLDITDVLPSEREQEDLILGLLTSGPKGVTETIADLGMIESEPPSDEGKRSNRQKTIQRFHRHATKLSEDRILEKFDSKYRLTESGELVAKLIQVRRDVIAELE